MLSAGHRLLAAALAGATLFAAACFQAPELTEPYRCTTPQQSCQAPHVCDDGVCCIPGAGGVPECPSHVGQDGKCSDGGTPRRYFQDVDEDGHGANGTERALCRDPATWRFSLDGGDCNDVPAAGGAAVYPGAPEQCDGLDNDCDGARDEGLMLTTFWRDQDGDGHGDPAGAVQACYPPPGHVTNSSDCQPERNDAHPGAVEVCNGVDDNCNFATDEGTDPGDACTVPGVSGPCAPGTRRCVGGGVTCVSNIQPSPEVCDGVDNNCDGTLDPPRPGCGGPLALGGTGEAVAFGAKQLASAYGGVATGCLKDAPAASPDDDSVNLTNITWSGYTGTSHVFWAESTAGLWDLSRAGATLRLSFTHSISSPNAFGTDVWDPHRQPVIHVCSPNGFLRLVYTAGYLIGPTDRGPTPVDNRMPLRGGSGWAIGANSSTNVEAVLRSVSRIEVLVQPEVASYPYASYVIDWYRPDFGFQ